MEVAAANATPAIQLPRDEEAIARERLYWWGSMYGWRGYDENGQRLKFSPMYEGWYDVQADNADSG